MNGHPLSRGKRALRVPTLTIEPQGWGTRFVDLGA